MNKPDCYPWEVGMEVAEQTYSSITISRIDRLSTPSASSSNRCRSLLSRLCHRPLPSPPATPPIEPIDTTRAARCVRLASCTLYSRNRRS